MSEDQGGYGMCGETSGFLFKHACANMSSASCSQCGKLVCAEHLHPGDHGETCTTCSKRERRRSRRQGGGYGHDPYFYGDSHYRGWGRYRHGYWGYSHYDSYNRHHHDRNDFTEADGAAARAEGNEDFEHDMDAS